MSLPYWPNKGMSSTESLASYTADQYMYACPNVTVKHLYRGRPRISGRSGAHLPPLGSVWAEPQPLCNFRTFQVTKHSIKLRRSMLKTNRRVKLLAYRLSRPTFIIERHDDRYTISILKYPINIDQNIELHPVGWDIYNPPTAIGRS